MYKDDTILVVGQAKPSKEDAIYSLHGEFCSRTGDGKDSWSGVQYDFVGDAQFCCVDAAWKEFENGFGWDAAEYPGKVFCTDSEAAHCLSEGRT